MQLVRHSGAALMAVAALPIGAALLAARPAWREGLRQRLGTASPGSRPGGLWLHAASLGELRAATPLAEHFRAEGRPSYLSTATVAARSMVATLVPGVAHGLMPLDHPWCVARALELVQPSVLCLIETELWPSWIAAAERRGTSVALVSARLSERHFPRYQRFRRWLQPTLRRIAAVGARSERDAERFASLGVDEARIEVTGDLKLDLGAGVEALSAELSHALREGAVFVAGCTHPGEEVVVLEAFAQLRAAGEAIALVLAPRHVDRAPGVARAVRRAGHAVRLRSEFGAGSAPLRAGEVMVLDRVGELASMYTRAAIAFVGGSLVPIGGHNLCEPIEAECPVLFGPCVESSRAVADVLLEAGAGVQVRDANDLARSILRALRLPEEREACIERARRALAVHRGAVVRSAALVETLFPPAAGSQPFRSESLRSESG